MRQHWKEPILGRGSFVNDVELPLGRVARALNEFFFRVLYSTEVVVNKA